MSESEQGQRSFDDGGNWSREPGDFDTQPLLRDVAFNRHSRNKSGGWRHVSPLANNVNDIGVDNISVQLLQGLPPERYVARVLSRAMNATTGHDVTGVSDDSIVDDPEWRDILRGGLQAVMEAFVIVFEVSGVSRACTHQLVRSRRAGFHQQSQRATSYTTPGGTGPNVRVPESVWQMMDVDSDLGYAYQRSLYWARRAYRLALDNDISYQDARYILPEGTENYIMCEYTLREFLAVYSYRACSMFNWEIVHVVRQMGELLKTQSPWLIGTGGEPRISCETTRGAIPGQQFGKDGKLLEHACTFQGWESVDDQCPFPWARDDNRTFKPSRK